MIRPAVILLLLCSALLPAAAVDVQLTVSLVNPGAPVVTSPPQALAGLGLPFRYIVRVANGPATFSATGLPPGLAIDPASGVISGTPTAIGTSQVVVRVTNASGAISWQLVITVVEQIGGTIPPLQGLPYREVGGVGCGAGRGLATMLILLMLGLGLGRRRATR